MPEITKGRKTRIDHKKESAAAEQDDQRGTPHKT